MRVFTVMNGRFPLWEMPFGNYAVAFTKRTIQSEMKNIPEGAPSEVIGRCIITKQCLQSIRMTVYEKWT